MSELARAKQRLRTTYLEWRRALPAERHREWSRKVCSVLSECRPVREARDLLLYHAVRGEVDLRPLAEPLSRRSARVFLPRVVSGERRLAVHELPDPGHLDTDEGDVPTSQVMVEGAYGVMEPDPDRCRAADLEELDAVLVPGVAFDRLGRRIGYGEGYYDGLLSRLPRTTSTVGVCFEGQLHSGELPVEEHDRSVGWIACETEGFRTGETRYGPS